MTDSNTTSNGIKTIAIGGAAGDGAREAGINFSELLNELGYKTFSSFDYPSLIRGGHNFARISYSIEPVYADYKELDVLVAVNAESVLVHQHSLKEGARVFVEEAYLSEVKDLGIDLIPLPMKKIAEELKAPQVARTSSAFGAYGYTLGIPLNQLKMLADKVYANVGSEMNVALVEKGYNHVKKLGVPQDVCDIPTEHGEIGEVMDGNKAIAKGFLAAGLEAYVGYPMTPSTSTLQFLAKMAKKTGLKVVHPEDEIAVLNMALGMSYAGKRTAVGTANGGFALMQETFSLAGVSEIPIAIMVAMRMGPATGVATHTSQGDLQFILHAGHGEFPRLVIAPGDVEECFECAADALNLAWKYQLPAVILSDKHLSESYKSVTLDTKSKGPDFGKRAVPVGSHYVRYKITEDGISPLAFPGKANVVVKATSYEHNEEGEAVEDKADVQTMQDKRFRKLNGLYQDFAWFPTVKTYGDEWSDVVIVFWGSTKGAMLEARKQLKSPAKLVQVLWMEPFDADRIKAELSGARVIIDVEANHTAQLAALIREKTSIEIHNKVLKYDAQPFTPTQLAEEINKFI
ncbi:MAG: Pyruvate flavodoxin/ferredoxin oxidoreductase domain protein [Parcubacteria group bacterium GW2011_GWA2_43_11]|nr:MAG: Pyruvate flavodoxin/ferredoxin oxidoreductase domain protein [Parcubacteria group bacterium GW2011_GWA2_43_11]